MDGYESEDDWTDRWPDDLVLDDTFVDAAEFRERSARERWAEEPWDGSEKPGRDYWGHPSARFDHGSFTAQDPGDMSPPYQPPWLDQGGPDDDDYYDDLFNDFYDGIYGGAHDDPFDRQHHESAHKRNRRRSRVGINIVVVIVLTALVAAYAVSQLVEGFVLRDANTVARATLGNEDPQAAIRPGAAGPDVSNPDAATKVVRGEGWPPAPSVRRTTRVAPAPPRPGGHGSHDFLLVQPDGSTPVAYDPCREIHYVTAGLAQAPLEGKRMVDEALAHLSRLTGLVFVDDGPTDEAPSDGRSGYQPDRYGERWAPVLVAWSNATESPRLAEGTDAGPDVLGFAGSSAAGVASKVSKSKGSSTSSPPPSGSGGSAGSSGSGGSAGSGGNGKVSDAEMVYVTGMIVLDSPDFASLLAINGGHSLARAVLLHELGHLLGLDHVDDRNELMYPTLQPDISDFGAGDRQGLAAVGSGKCMPDI